MKLPLLFFSLLALCSTLTRADDILRVDLDGHKGVAAPEQEDGKDGIARIKSVPTPLLEIFPSGLKAAAKGTIMISPGGGYGILAVTHEGRDVARALNAAGWDCAVLLYHVSAGPTTRDLAIADAKKGLALLQTRGGEFGLPTRNVGVMGFSAGGHLTARVARETAASNPPKFVILIYPAYLEKDGKVLDEVAPLKVPAFLYVAENDHYHTSAVAYDAALTALGVPHFFEMPKEGGHGFGLKKEMPEAVKDWLSKLITWLETVKQP